MNLQKELARAPKVILDTLVDVSRGSELLKKDRDPEGKYEAIFTGELFNYPFIVIDPVSRTNGNEKKQFSRGGEIVFCGDAENAEGILSTFRVVMKPEVLLHGSVLSPKEGAAVDSKYLAYLLRYSEGIVRHFARGHTIVHMYPKDLVTASIPLPSLPVQKKIAAFLDAYTSTLDSSVQLQEERVKLLKVAKELQWDKMFEHDKKWGPLVPLGETLRTSPDKKASLPEEFIYLDLASVKSGKVVQENWTTKEAAPGRAQLLLKKDDIIYQTARPYQKNNLLVPDKYAGHVASNGYVQLRNEREDEVSTAFMYQLLSSEYFARKAMAVATGSIWPAISESLLASRLIPLPPLPQQQAIAAYFDKLDEQIRLEEERLELLKLQRRVLLAEVTAAFQQE